MSALPPHVLREYALLADGERGAVVGPRGDIVWMCVPRWDSDAVFSALIGGHGGYTVTPDDTYVWGGYYEDASMIWRNRWTTRSGIVECRDALAYPAEPHRAILCARSGPSTARRRSRSRCGRARATTSSRCGAAPPRGMWTARTGGLYLRWPGAEDAAARLGVKNCSWR